MTSTKTPPIGFRWLPSLASHAARYAVFCGAICLIAVAVAGRPAAAQTPSRGFGSIGIGRNAPPDYITGSRDYSNKVVSMPSPTTGSSAQDARNYGFNTQGIFSDETYSFNGAFGPNGTLIQNNPASTDYLGFGGLALDFDGGHQFQLTLGQGSSGRSYQLGAATVSRVIWLVGGPSEEPEDVRIAKEVAVAVAGPEPIEPTTNILARSPDVAIGVANRTANPTPVWVSASPNGVTNGVGLLYGLRVIGQESEEHHYFTGSILGRTQTDIVADNNIVGPHAGVVVALERGRWSAGVQGTVSAGYNNGDVHQNNAMGEELIPGAVNRLLFAQPTRSSHRDPHNELSLSGEVRAEINYQLTNTTRFRLWWSGLAADNVRLVNERIRWFLPDMGLLDPGKQHVFTDHLFCGIEMLH